MRKVRIKGRGVQQQIHEPYSLNEIPQSVIHDLGKRIVHLLAVGYADMSGDTFCQMYADSISGQSLGGALGVADVIWDNCAWSVKTVKNKYPHRVNRVRLISGRNSPNYSAGISDPLVDLQATGSAILDIYNARIHQAGNEHDTLRLLVLVRNMTSLEFTLYERSIAPVPVNNYKWQTNRRGNLEAYEGDTHVFTWQPHGSQFTIIENVPLSATKFRIKQHPGKLSMKHVLELTQFETDWIEVVS